MVAAHADFIRSTIAQADILSRAERFPEIARTFSPSVLSSFTDRPPYYCHYMAWRLAVLPNSYLARFDHLLSRAAGIEGWKNEASSLVPDPDFSTFWSLLWQLQVAEYLLERGYALQWGSNGPDLRAERDGQVRYIECTTPRKHFGRSLFLEELLRRLHPDLRVETQMFLKRSMPQAGELDAFLDGLLRYLLEPGRLDSLADEAATRYPVLIPLPEGASNLCVYMDGHDVDAYDPRVLSRGHGDVDAYWDLILKEVVSNKAEANNLASCRPNAVLVNFLLGYDQQAATWMGEAPSTDLGPNIDELVWGRVGIDGTVEQNGLASVRGWLP